MNSINSIGVDIGGSHITVCNYHLEKMELQESCLVNKKIDSRGSKEDIIAGWMEAIDECRELISTDIKGIGVAMPGPFDYYNGISLIEGLDKLNALYQVNIRLELSELLRLQPSNIRFINDATAFSIAESRVGCARDSSRVVAITLGTGLGSSFLIDSKPILKDKSVPDGGFLYNQFYRNELADNMFSTRGVLALYKKMSGNDAQSVRKLCEIAEQDPLAKECFLEFGKTLGEFLRPYLTEFGAETLVMGGNISKAFPHFGETLKTALGDIRIKESRLGEKAAIIGSALLMDDDYYADIESTLKLM